MTKIFLFALTIASLTFLSCKKERLTIVNGTVVDKITGQPIPDVYISIQIKHKPATDGSSNNETDYIKTGIDGKFNFEKYLPVQFFDMKKSGYLPKGGSTGFINIRQDEINNLIVEMIPKNALLDLKINNSTNQPDSVYVAIYSPAQHSEAPISSGIILRKGYTIQSMSEHNVLINLASDENIDIYWGFSPLPYNVSTSLFHDNIFISRNDTTSHVISF